MRNLIRLLVILNIIGLVAYGVRFYVLHNRGSDVTISAEEKRKYGESVAAIGAMNASDAVRIAEISRSVLKDGQLSDADMDFAYGILKTTLSRHDNGVLLARGMILSLWIDTPHFSEGQKVKIFDIARSLLNRMDTVVKAGTKTFRAGDKMLTARLLGKMGDMRGVPFLLPLLDHPDILVRQEARKSLEKLGYRG